MEQIPGAIVEKTWQEVAGISPKRAEKEMIKLGNSQPAPSAFVIESVEEEVIFNFIIEKCTSSYNEARIRALD